MNIGIIGTGKIGSTLAEGLCSTDQKNKVFIYNRTIEKAFRLKSKFSCIEVLKTPEKIVKSSDLMFFAVPFSYIKNISTKLFNILKSVNPLVIALCGYVPLEILEKSLPAKVAKAFPNINWACGSGVTIICFGNRIVDAERQLILSLLNRLGSVYEIMESEFRGFSNIMSCGPALWIKMIDYFIETNVMKYGINRELAFEVSERTIIGTFRLMHENGLKVDEIISLVSSPGGVTEVALEVFKKYMPSAFFEAVNVISQRDSERINALNS